MNSLYLWPNYTLDNLSKSCCGDWTGLPKPAVQAAGGRRCASWELSYFEVEASSPLEGHGSEPDSLLAIAENLLARGLLTRAPLS